MLIPSILTSTSISFDGSLIMGPSVSSTVPLKTCLWILLQNCYQAQKWNISHLNWGFELLEGECWDFKKVKGHFPWYDYFIYHLVCHLWYVYYLLLFAELAVFVFHIICHILHHLLLSIYCLAMLLSSPIYIYRSTRLALLRCCIAYGGWGELQISLYQYFTLYLYLVFCSYSHIR